MGVQFSSETFMKRSGSLSKTQQHEFLLFRSSFLYFLRNKTLNLFHKAEELWNPLNYRLWFPVLTG